jgi:hypothetical protein
MFLAVFVLAKSDGYRDSSCCIAPKLAALRCADSCEPTAGALLFSLQQEKTAGPSQNLTGMPLRGSVPSRARAVGDSGQPRGSSRADWSDCCANVKLWLST